MATVPTTSPMAIMKEGRIKLSCQPGPVRSSGHGCWPPGVAELYNADFLATT